MHNNSTTNTNDNNNINNNKNNNSTNHQQHHHHHLQRTNPMGKEYYWLTGELINKDKGQDTDEWALNKKFISIVPVQYDLTAHHVIQELNTWNFG